ncbi:MAG TPA: hypothetical protein VMX97_02390, partial [Hyphomicrobiaceae bacterium]|nr:hypothetical protein [Hyphomicrobiaceae bacterium]
MPPGQNTGRRDRSARKRARPERTLGVRSASMVAGAGRGCLLLGKILLPIVLLLGLAVGVLYVRLANGPLTVNFLATPIANAINAELSGLKVQVTQAVIRLDGQHLALQLQDVTLLDRQSTPVAVAPLAAIELSRKAFLEWRISPSRIVLIEPRLLLFYSPANGLSLHFAKDPVLDGSTKLPAKLQGRTAQGAQPAAAPSVPQASASAEPPSNLTAGRIDLARAVASLAKRVRRQEHASAFLEKIGMRNATVILDYSGTQTAWRVPAADLDLAHFQRHSVVSGRVDVASTRGVWRIVLRAEESEQTNTVNLRASVRDVYPESIAAAIPSLSMLRSLRFPVGAEANISLSSEGELLAGDFNLELAQGLIELPWRNITQQPSLQSGNLALSYRRGRSNLVLAPSTLRWANSEITVEGIALPPPDGAAAAGWGFKLAATRGLLSAAGVGGPASPIKHWSATGRVLAGNALLEIDQAVLQTRDGSMALRGQIFGGDRPGYAVAGTISDMPARSALLFWPGFLAEPVRNWYVGNLLEGRFGGGRFQSAVRYDTAPSAPSGTGAGGTSLAAGKTEWSTSIAFDFEGVRFRAGPDLPDVLAPKLKVRFERDRLEVAADDAAFAGEGKKPLTFKAATLLADKVYGNEVDGHLSL